VGVAPHLVLNHGRAALISDASSPLGLRAPLAVEAMKYKRAPALDNPPRDFPVSLAYSVSAQCSRVSLCSPGLGRPAAPSYYSVLRTFHNGSQRSIEDYSKAPSTPFLAQPMAIFAFKF